MRSPDAAAGPLPCANLGAEADQEAASGDGTGGQLMRGRGGLADGAKHLGGLRGQNGAAPQEAADKTGAPRAVADAGDEGAIHNPTDAEHAPLAEQLGRAGGPDDEATRQARHGREGLRDERHHSIDELQGCKEPCSQFLRNYLITDRNASHLR